MAAPGAAMSTDELNVEKLARASRFVVAATDTTPGKLAG